jgi:hypothetical protein
MVIPLFDICGGCAQRRLTPKLPGLRRPDLAFNTGSPSSGAALAAVVADSADLVAHLSVVAHFLHRLRVVGLGPHTQLTSLIFPSSATWYISAPNGFAVHVLQMPPDLVRK